MSQNGTGFGKFAIMLTTAIIGVALILGLIPAAVAYLISETFAAAITAYFLYLLAIAIVFWMALRDK